MKKVVVRERERERETKDKRKWREKRNRSECEERVVDKERSGYKETEKWMERERKKGKMIISA